MNQQWWCVPVVPATPEAEAGESLKPQSWEVAVSRDPATALQPGDRGRLCLKKEIKEKCTPGRGGTNSSDGWKS